MTERAVARGSVLPPSLTGKIFTHVAHKATRRLHTRLQVAAYAHREENAALTTARGSAAGL